MQFSRYRLLVSWLLFGLTPWIHPLIQASEPPVIQFFNPSIGSVGTSVTITGENFVEVQAIKFNQTTVTNFSVVGNQIGVNVPSGASTGPITVITSSGSDTSGGLFLVEQTGVPEITQFSPAEGSPGSVVTISGEHFAGITEVTFNGVPASAFTLIGSQISVTVPLGATSGRIGLKSPTGAGQSSAEFRVVQVPAPWVGEFSPISGPVGTLVTITGSNFVAVTSVKFGGVESTGFTMIGSQISTTVPVGAKTGPIQIQTATGLGASQSPFFITEVPAPSIASFVPANGPAGTRVTITGSFFKDTSAVTFGGKSANFLVFGNQIFATVPEGAATGFVSVTTPSGRVTSTESFLVTSSNLPKILDFEPTSGAVGSTITLKGENLFEVTSVKVGGVDASFNLAASPNITIMVPLGAKSGVIEIRAAGGVATSANAFNVTAVTDPRIVSFSPESGPAGSIVILSGDNLQSVTSVRIGEVEVSFLAFGSQVFVTLPVNATTGFISLVTPSGTTRSPRPFVIGETTPTILEFSPTKAAAGDKVVVLGANLSRVTRVDVGELEAQITAVSGSEVHFIVPNDAENGAIRLFTSNGNTATPGQLIILPKIASFSPSSGSTKQSVTVLGTGFHSVERVEFNGLSAVFERVSSREIRIVVPDQATSGKITVVTMSGAANSSVPFSYIVDLPITPPALEIQVGTPGRVVITWPNSNPAFQLQTSSQLGEPWIPEPTQPLVVSGRRQVELDSNFFESRFFRVILIR